VVDNNLNLLPIGVVGELMIGGISLARGYLNHPNLTAEKFISNPFQTKKEKSGARNARLYKTGDLVRWLPNGNLEYIGRNDFQIKVRGYRIEPAEIESKLQEIESIEQVLVIALQDSKNDKFLCAYYTAKQEINSVELSTKLSATLASYMIPDCFIWLDKFPINSNGKIDSKLLPKPDFTNHAKEYVAPSNGHEKLICDAFCAVLGLEKVSVHDDFFMLGGSSIKAITLVSNLQANFIINVSDIFNLKTPKHIAKNITFVKNYLRQRLGKIKQIYQIKSSINIDNKQLQDKQTNYLKSLNSLPAHYQKKSISNVLLTGATGYLGCNLLNQLITSTDYKIYLLVRAKSQKEAFNRVNRKFEFYFDKSLESLRGSRVFVFAADIEENDLGLSLKNYQALADKIDSIIHSAALTKHYGEYDKFYSANVQATINLLEFSKLTQLKDFHYISTSSVLDHGYVPDHDQYVFTEDDLGEQLDNQLNVYIKTKHEGEKEVIKYREQGIAGNIYRVGNLAFISSNYRTQENIEDNGFYTRLKCILKLKATAREIGTEEISPVDLTAQAIIKLFDKKQLSNSIQHVFNPNLCNIAEILSQDKTLGLKAIPINEFIDIVIKYLDKPNEHKLIERFLLHQGWLEEHTDSTTIKILQDRTNHILHQLGFDWPQIKQEMFQKYIENNLLKPEKDKTMGLLKKGA
jgi:surfactin family lipopeptide synthetase A